MGEANQLWALTAWAGDADATSRAALADRMAAWIAAGGNGISLATCHRAELYGIGDRPVLGAPTELTGAAAIRHLLRVAAGLESAIVGEDEVLHQVRQTLRDVREAGTLDYRLGRLFDVAIATGRRARAAHPRASISLADRAVQWLGERIPFRGSEILIVGSGRVGAAAMRAVVKHGARVAVASRSAERAQRLAAIYGVEGYDLREAVLRAQQSDGIVFALAGAWPETSEIAGPLPPIADLSAPPALADHVRAAAVHHLSIDELVGGGTLPPPGYVDAAMREVDRGILELTDWLEQRDRLELRKAASR
jgi:glutamyl-tRNA reductase